MRTTTVETMGDGPPEGSTSVEAILSATRRVIAERGPEKFTMSAIAAAAGVSRPTLYRWFPTKDELLEALTAYEEELFDAAPPGRDRRAAHPGPAPRRRAARSWSPTSTG